MISNGIVNYFYRGDDEIVGWTGLLVQSKDGIQFNSEKYIGTLLKGPTMVRRSALCRDSDHPKSQSTTERLL